jgi:hypothetical protein
MAPHAQPPVKGIFTVLAKAMPNVRVLPRRMRSEAS